MTGMPLLDAILIGLAAMAAALLLAFGIGLCLPRRHRFAAERMLPLSPEEAWQRLSDLPSYPTWQPWLDRVERLSGVGDTVGVVWRQIEKKGDRLDLEVTAWEPGRKLVLRTADAGLPFRGVWTLEVEPCLGGCKVRAVEDGEIPGPLARTLWRLFRPRLSSVERFLTALAQT